MKNLFAILTLTSTLSVLACPELEGAYSSCKSKSLADMFSVDQIVITQGKEGAGTMVYSIKSYSNEGLEQNEYLVLNKYVDISPTTDFGSDDEENMKVLQKVSCSANKLVIDEKAEMEGMEMTTKVEVSKNDKNELQVMSYMDGSLVNTTTCL